MKNFDKREIRLREKLLAYGAEKLSDAELLAVLISSGSKGRTCLQLAEDLLKQFGDLRAILNADLSHFKKVSGLGNVRYVQLQAAHEICKRNDFIHLRKENQLTHSQQACIYLKRKLRDKKNETFAAIFLDTQYHIISYEELFNGTINATVVHIRPILDRILKLNAAAVILAHNHPSGVSEASSFDREITEKIKEALSLVDAKLLDHLVIGDNEVYSILHDSKWECM
ncbi:DNA repair protein RadC (plasmid) [Legionella adelaidensis]|uniref:DNA repair protein RadC n=1 Tax=Legionella adelaidensis TaxID=45056 RepID=A0A0W0R5E5_9GAMM|nr:DNA repair protein RadC [Legionella adelaidensis]KTC66303.1 DNA repair protein RadC [Legionella adelaidensis]VEH84899.1 DNA repair protein RadC [Legionella adelaidensis]